MKKEKLSTQELCDLIFSYQIGSTDLNFLCFESELLVEEMRPHLSSGDFSSFMNCVYVLEEINALILDEARSLTYAENAEIEGQLALLKKLVNEKTRPDSD